MTRRRMLLVVALTVWFTAGVVAAGYYNDEFRKAFPKLNQCPRHAKKTFAQSLMTIPFGLISLTVDYLDTGFFDGLEWTMARTPMPRVKGTEWDIWCPNEKEPT